MVKLSISSNSNAWLLPSYVVQQASGLLPNEALHSALVGADLHIPQAHIHVPEIHTHDRHMDQVRMVWISARLWNPGAIVAAARGTLGDTPIYAMPDGFAEQLLAFLRLPTGADAGTIALRLYLATDINAIGPGVCQMVSELTGYSEGDPITATGGGIMQNIDIRNSGAGISLMEISQPLGYTPMVGPFDYFALQITRRGDLGGDTYAGTVNLIGMEVAFDFES